MLQLKDVRYSGIIADLLARGFENSFTLCGDQLFLTGSEYFLTTGKYRIVEMHYIPCEDGVITETILYAIYIPGHCLKGLLLVTGLQKNTSFLVTGTRWASGKLVTIETTKALTDSAG